MMTMTEIMRDRLYARPIQFRRRCGMRQEGRQRAKHRSRPNVARQASRSDSNASNLSGRIAADGRTRSGSRALVFPAKPQSGSERSGHNGFPDDPRRRCARNPAPAPDGRMLIAEKVGPLWLVTQQGEKTLDASNAPRQNVNRRRRDHTLATAFQKIKRLSTA